MKEIQKIIRFRVENGMASIKYGVLFLFFVVHGLALQMLEKLNRVICCKGVDGEQRVKTKRSKTDTRL